MGGREYHPRPQPTGTIQAHHRDVRRSRAHALTVTHTRNSHFAAASKQCWSVSYAFGSMPIDGYHVERWQSVQAPPLRVNTTVCVEFPSRWSMSPWPIIQRFTSATSGSSAP
mmetsp:Transcript_15651/g.47513  ORF Transcript_15651/g.47513 Transcript_15651/m.47513 type:complete len:112 (+) Transcript_15651:53-388(+)